MANRVRILLYHRVECIDDDNNLLAISPKLFYEHMRWLKDNYRISRLSDDFKDWFSIDKDTCIITFDDGYYDFARNVVPILNELNIPATVFISTGSIGGDELWTDKLCRAVFSPQIYNDSFCFEFGRLKGKLRSDSISSRSRMYNVLRSLLQMMNTKEKNDFISEMYSWAGIIDVPRENRRLMSEQEIKHIANNSLIDIGSHCVTHPSLRWGSDKDQRYEITNSKETLEKLTGKCIELFSYPFGTVSDYSKDTIKLLKEANYSKAVVGWPGCIVKDTDVYQIPRYTIRNLSLDSFKAYIKNSVFYGQNNDFMNATTLQCNNTSIEQDDYIGYIEDDLYILNSHKKIVIWGTGEYGKRVFDYLNVKGLSDRVICFADNDKNKHNMKIKGKIVLGLSEIKEDILDKMIIISGVYAAEIYNQLKNEKICNIRWVFF